MSTVLNNPDDPNHSNRECPVAVIVPEEFTGSSVSELQTRRGSITGMDVKSGVVVIQAVIPEREYDELAQAIKDRTQNRGNVERQL